MWCIKWLYMQWGKHQRWRVMPYRVRSGVQPYWFCSRWHIGTAGQQRPVPLCLVVLVAGSSQRDAAIICTRCFSDFPEGRHPTPLQTYRLSASVTLINNSISLSLSLFLLLASYSVYKYSRWEEKKIAWRRPTASFGFQYVKKLKRADRIRNDDDLLVVRRAATAYYILLYTAICYYNTTALSCQPIRKLLNIQYDNVIRGGRSPREIDKRCRSIRTTRWMEPKSCLSTGIEERLLYNIVCAKWCIYYHSRLYMPPKNITIV